MYTAKNVRFKLEVAKRGFLQASVGIHGGSKVNRGWEKGELLLYSFLCLPSFCSSSNLKSGTCTTIVHNASVLICLINLV